jgi:predicted GTPase
LVSWKEQKGVVILVNKWDLKRKRCQLEIMKKKSEKN